MAKHLVEVFNKKDYGVPAGKGAQKRLETVGLKGIKEVSTSKIYQIEGEYTEAQIKKIAAELLCDPVLEEFSLCEICKTGAHKVEVWIRDSSTDVVGESVQDAIAAMGYAKPKVRIANSFLISGTFSDKELETAVKKTFVNEVVNKFSIKHC